MHLKMIFHKQAHSSNLRYDQFLAGIDAGDLGQDSMKTKTDAMRAGQGVHPSKPADLATMCRAAGEAKAGIRFTLVVRRIADPALQPQL